MQHGSQPGRLVDFYAFLGVRPNATEADIIAAYRALIAGADAARAQRAAQVVAVLMDAQQRAEYDRALAASRAGGSARSPGPPPGPVGNGATAIEPARTTPLAAPGGPPRPDTIPPPGGAPGSPSHGPAGSVGSRGSGLVPTQPARPAGPPAPPATLPQGRTRAAAQSIPRWRTAHRQRSVQGGARRGRLALLLGAAMLIGSAVVALLLGTNASNGGAPFASGQDGGAPAELVANAVAAPLVDGVQTLDVVVNGERWRYEPNVIKVQKGLPVRFNLTVKGDPG